MTFPVSIPRLLVPNDLARSPTAFRRVLVIGSCLAEGIPPTLERMWPTCQCDYVLFNNAMDLPSAPPRPITAYDFQLLQLPIRSLLPESVVMRLSFADTQSYQMAFDLASEKLVQMLEAGLRYAAGATPAFVTNFMVPQGTALGRLLPKADLRNPSHFVAKLNEVLTAHVTALPDVYLLDIDALSSALGRVHLQDDLVWSVTHGGVLTDWDYQRDLDRLSAPTPLTAQLDIRSGQFLEVMGYEIEAMYRTLRHVDAVKLVIVDLDDTLWRGVLAEQDALTPDVREGWPLGMAEALTVLKRRGILLAIVSKNDLDRISAMWDDIFLGVLRLEDFAAVQINWGSKPDNVRQVIADVNLLPSSVVYIDDNAAERAAVQRALPEVRVLGANIYEVRRILLWSAETQVSTLTEESLNRTEMVKSQAQRDAVRAKLPREAFLRELNVQVTVSVIRAVEDPQVARVLELINKTNQFNSTGERWSAQDLAHFLTEGGLVHAFRVTDTFTQYGLTAVALTRKKVVEQFVMSCRVMGLEAERSMLRYLSGKREEPLTIRFRETARNRPIREVFDALGAVVSDGSVILEVGAWATGPAVPQVTSFTAGRR